MRQPFQNLVVDHMTFLVEPRFYKVTYALFRLVFGVEPEDVIYNKRRTWPGEKEEKSMTFAARLGRYEGRPGLDSAIVAVVEPSEPAGQSSHVRDILKNRGGSAHWQHIALRTPDLVAFHEHCLKLGVNFITPILKDEEEDLIQVFSGEWTLPGRRPTGIFFEFVQRDPDPETIKRLEARQAFFRDKTFLGLYQQKEDEYRGGRVQPFIDDALFLKIESALGDKPVWRLDERDLSRVESLMLDYARPRIAG
ncbi:MAG: hypothetical protein KGO96_02170 [Elusimicrobia bacterium]|nr:hypothetical protein [Elusimicrobiota bacterium]MDE2424702.1 hypothetical protein [Elusimicrobiota bacterium]